MNIKICPLKYDHNIVVFHFGGKSTSPHSLVENAQTSGLADDQIGPLHNDNRHKEPSVGSKLQNFSVLVGLQN